MDFRCPSESGSYISLLKVGNMPTNENQANGGQRDALQRYNSTSRRQLLCLVGAGGVAGFAGCSTGDDGGAETDTEPDVEQDTGTATATEEKLQQSATIGLPRSVTGDWTAFYGGMSGYFTRVLEPLVWTNSKLKPKPWLATDWQATGDKTWEFSLREDITFHNGKSLNADAVDFSFKTFLNQSWTEGWLKIEDVSPVDEMTVEITNTKPVGNFPATIAHNLVAVQHPNRTKGVGSKGQPIGTGPYKVEEIKKGQHVKVSAYDDYWKSSPKMEELTFRELSDPNTRALALMGHQIDVGLELPMSQVESIKKAEKTNAQIESKPQTSLFYINTVRGPTTDIKLRKAINYAVAKKKAINGAMNGVGKAARGPIPPMIYWSNHDSLPAYGPDKAQAKELIKQSEYDGETIRILANPNSSFLNKPKLLVQVIQQAFKDVGLNAELQMTENLDKQEDAAAEGTHLYLDSPGTVSAGSDYLLQDVYHSENAQIAKWIPEPLPNEKVDTLLDKGLQAQDPEQKKEAYGKVQQIIMEKAIILPVAHPGWIAGTYKDIGKFDFPPRSEFSRWENIKHRE